MHLAASTSTGVISVSCTDLTYPGLRIHHMESANISSKPQYSVAVKPQSSPKIGAKLRQHFQGFYSGTLNRSSDVGANGSSQVAKIYNKSSPADNNKVLLIKSASADTTNGVSTPTSPSIKAKISKSFNDWTSSERLKLWRSKLPHNHSGKGKKLPPDNSNSQQPKEVGPPILQPSDPPQLSFVQHKLSPSTTTVSTAGTPDRTGLVVPTSTVAAGENTYDSANGNFEPLKFGIEKINSAETSFTAGEEDLLNCHQSNSFQSAFNLNSNTNLDRFGIINNNSNHTDPDGISNINTNPNGSVSDVEVSRLRSRLDPRHFGSLKHSRTGPALMPYRNDSDLSFPDSFYSELSRINRSAEKRNSLASFYQQELAKKVFLQQQLKVAHPNPLAYSGKTSKSYGNLYSDDKIYEEIDFAPDINQSLVSNIPPPVKIAPLSGIRSDTDASVIRPIAFRPIPAPGGTIAYTARPAYAESFSDPPDLPLMNPPQMSESPKTPARYPSFNERRNYNLSEKTGGKGPAPPSYDPHKAVGYWDNINRTQSFPAAANISPAKSPGAVKRDLFNSPRGSQLKPLPFGTSNGEYDLIPPLNPPISRHNSALPHPPAYAIEPAELLGKSPALPHRYHQSAKEPLRYQPASGHSQNGAGEIYCPAGSQSSRNSSGIQVTTPSPSDSGHAGDIETVLKERENEILQLRQTMDHNEKVIVRVYQEKEERWYEKIKQWASRLETALKTEQKLSEEVQQLRDERVQLQRQVDNLSDDRIGLQSKIRELEKNYFEVKRQLEFQANSSMCSQCGEPIYANSATFLADKDEIFQQTDKRLMEAPNPLRLSKSPTPTDSLRSEVGSLREEISGLRSSLLDQMSSFHDEKSRWEVEKLKVVDYQKLLQENYVEMFRRNKSLEQQLMQLSEDVNTADRSSTKSSQSPSLSLSRMSCNSDPLPILPPTTLIPLANGTDEHTTT